MLRPADRRASWELTALAAAVLLSLLLPAGASAWGEKGNKLIVSSALGTLPQEMRPFFEANRDFLLQHVTGPKETVAKNPAERKNQFLFLERYGRFPFDSLPRSYKAAVAKFSRAKLEANGLLPWQIGVYSEKLTNAMRAGKWDEARENAALLAYYVGAAHDPFNTTDNQDGQLSGQAGLSLRFGTNLIERYASFFPLRPNDAIFVNEPTEQAFEACLSAHSWLETILLADRNSRRGLPSYTDEYYDRFFNQAAAILIRQISDSATDVGSYWYTAWVNAGKPALPQH
ncbi:MAG: hypothetical protein LAN71_10730 [Acidobacteriia bacterium]|nr:hypothetical protein [Terriglobia bacterium]